MKAMEVLVVKLTRVLSWSYYITGEEKSYIMYHKPRPFWKGEIPFKAAAEIALQTVGNLKEGEYYCFPEEDVLFRAWYTCPKEKDITSGEDAAGAEFRAEIVCQIQQAKMRKQKSIIVVAHALQYEEIRRATLSEESLVRTIMVDVGHGFSDRD